MAGRLDARDRRAQVGRLFRVATVSMLLIAVGVLVVGSMGGLGGADIRRITCTECREHFIAYNHFLDPDSLDPNASEIEPLTPAMGQSMTTHLGYCVSCRRLFQDEFPGVLTTARVPQRLPVLANFSLFPRPTWE